MKFSSKIILFTLILFIFTTSSSMAFMSHFAAGPDGIKVGTMGPPGKVYLQYNIVYMANDWVDNKGNSVDSDNKLTVAMQAHRFINVAHDVIFGADICSNLILSVGYKGLELETPGGEVELHEYGLGDTFIEPAVLSWHEERYDFNVGLGVWVPTGDFDEGDPTSMGNGYTELLLSIGGTYYFDEQKTTHFSLLTRTTDGFEQDDTGIDPGLATGFVWGLGKTFVNMEKKRVIDAGIIGFNRWQIGDDDGAANSGNHGEDHKIGVEFDYMWLDKSDFLNFRVLWDYYVEAGNNDIAPKGVTANLSLGFAF